MSNRPPVAASIRPKPVPAGTFHPERLVSDLQPRLGLLQNSHNYVPTPELQEDRLQVVPRPFLDSVVRIKTPRLLPQTKKSTGWNVLLMHALYSWRLYSNLMLQSNRNYNLALNRTNATPGGRYYITMITNTYDQQSYYNSQWFIYGAESKGGHGQ